MLHTNRVRVRSLAPIGTLLALGAFTACGSSNSRDAFAKERIYEPIGNPTRWNASVEERFRLDRSEFKAARASGPASLHWTTPAGWSELPATAMRVANFRVAGDENAECYLTTLAGSGGGLDANVNRWRKQMAQSSLSPEEIAALPRMDWFGKPSVLIEIDGTWSGMSGDKNGSDFRMLGLLQVDDSGSKFLKLVGPRERVVQETERFKELAASFHADGGDGHEAPHAAADPHGPSDIGPPDDGMHGLQGMPADATHSGLASAQAASGATTASAGSSAFTWTAPAGWVQGPEKAMREVTFLAGAKSEVECYVTALTGDGGGLAANLNRWRQQLGREPLTDAEIAALPSVPMLGTHAALVEIQRADGESNASPSALIGAVCLQPERSVFVKLLGPTAAVEGQRDAFVEFCKSIRGAR